MNAMKKSTKNFLIGLAPSFAIMGLLLCAEVRNPLYPLLVFVSGLALTSWHFERNYNNTKDPTEGHGHLIPFRARQIIFFTGLFIGMIYAWAFSNWMK